MENWRIATLVGALIFLFSSFLPLLSAGALGFTISLSLIDLYRLASSATPYGGSYTFVPSGVYGIVLTMVLYPVTVILGFASYLNRKIALVAGILGIICWLGAILAINDLNRIAMGMIQYGAGIFVGIIGAIILLVAYSLKTQVAPQLIPPQPAQPPPPQP